MGALQGVQGPGNAGVDGVSGCSRQNSTSDNKGHGARHSMFFFRVGWWQRPMLSPSDIELVLPFHCCSQYEQQSMSHLFSFERDPPNQLFASCAGRVAIARRRTSRLAGTLRLAATLSMHLVIRGHSSCATSGSFRSDTK